MNRLHFASALVVAATSSGCFLFASPDSSPPISAPIETKGDPAPAWQVEVGSGEAAFAPLADDAHVTVEHGPQGGSHVWTSLKVEGVALEYVQVEIEVRDANSAVVSRAISSGAVQKDFILGQRAYVANDFHGEALIRVKIANTGGTLWAADERHVIVE